MVRRLFSALVVPESEEPRVERLLTLLIRGGIITSLVLAFLSYFLRGTVGQATATEGYVRWGLTGALLFLAFLGLRYLNVSGERPSLTANLLVATVILYAAIGPLSLWGLRLALMIYVLAIALVTLLLPHQATFIWGGVAVVIFFVQVLMVAIVGEQAVDIKFILLGASALGIAILVLHLFSAVFYQTQDDFRRQIQQGRASIEIGHTVSSSLDPSSVIRQAVRLIHDAFGYYHVGLFVVDREENIAVLSDAAGMAALELLDRGFAASLIGTSTVAAAINHKRQWVTVSWEERVDPRGRTITFTHERLPARAELVLPLQVGERVLGALDILSTELDPFSEEDVHTLEGLVGNVANALEGARLLDDVQQRHQELTALYAQTERRARYLEATAKLARVTSSMLEPQPLMDSAVELISEGLELYHTGIFLIDDTREWAVLIAANSEGGQEMLERGHKLQVGQQGIVGWVTSVGEPRIALDVGEDAVYFDNRYLPDTRSEIALPLQVGGRIIGALDVQSVREAAFSDEDAVVLQTLADQVAIGIQNAQLFQETQRALEEVQALQRYYVAQQWENISRQRSDLRAEYRSLGVPALDETWLPEMDIAFNNEEPVVLSDFDALDDGNGRSAGQDALKPLSALAVPIKLQDEVIGVLDLQEMDEERQWTEEDIEMATSVADQLALALENARLVEETQRRARQMAAASEVARDATAILDAEQLLNETVELISERFGFYHAGAFLLDEQNEYAVLSAASSEGGQEMLQNSYQLKIGEVGIVGYVAATGESRIVSDVDEDVVWHKNPYLPQTRSEMALPLQARGRVIGVLDVQSTEPAAFTEDDVEVLQTLADQLATAIANADLFRQVREEATRRALINEVTQAAASSLDIDELLERAGRAISRQLEMPSAVFEWDEHNEVLMPVVVHNPAGDNVISFEPEPFTLEMDPAMFKTIRTRQLQVVYNVLEGLSGAAEQMAQQLDLLDVAYIPLMARERPLGLLALGRHRGHPALDEGELSFLEVVAVNLGVALENARLYRDAVETAERLAEVDRLKTQFLATMSHELRTPLNSIIGFTRVILKEIDGPLTDLQRTDLQTVYDSGNHLLGLINNILDVMRIEAGRMELSLEEVEIPAAVESVMATAVALVKDKDVELQQDIPDDVPLIKADGRRIRQVLINLVGNAAKFTDEGYIRVKVRADEEDVTFAVIDTGEGIPKDKLQMIFEAFTQVDSSSTRKAGGTGLGLSICQSFVHMHGGSIWVESELGKGSTFYFSIPIDGPPVEPEEVVEEEAVDEVIEEGVADEGMTGQESKLVLCIEDDEGVITLFRRYLSKRGYRVVGLTDPTRALDEAKRLKPHAITLDVMMPDKNGWQVIQELKADPQTRGIPVIMCTIITEQDRGVSLGAADYLVKPVVEQDLLAALDRLDREAGRHLVLVVDDQEEHRQLLRRIIETQDGYQVEEACGGKEAIDMLQDVHPQLIMLDLMMPEMDGFEVLERVKSDAETRSIPIVVVTAKELTDEDYERLNHHVEALIEKGVMKKQELLDDVAAALKKLTRPRPVVE